MHCKIKIVTKDKEHFIITRGQIHQEDITIINIYAPNNRTPKYTKQQLTELKEEIDNSTITFGDFNTLLSIWITQPHKRSARNQKTQTLQTNKI